MTAVEVGNGTGGNNRVNIRSIERIAKARRVSADNYKWTGETSAATTYTVTIVATPATGGITIDYAST